MDTGNILKLKRSIITFLQLLHKITPIIYCSFYIISHQYFPRLIQTASNYPDYPVNDSCNDYTSKPTSDYFQSKCQIKDISYIWKIEIQLFTTKVQSKTNLPNQSGRKTGYKSNSFENIEVDKIDSLAQICLPKNPLVSGNYFLSNHFLQGILPCFRKKYSQQI